MSDQPSFKFSSNIVSTLVGVSLILLGILFLIGRYIGTRFGIDFGHYTWPFFIITPGVFLFMASFAFERRTGMIQNTFDLFASWAYAWALVAPTSIGLAKLVYGGLRGLQDQVKSGMNLIGVGLAIFVFGGFFFELGIGISGFHFGAA